MEMKERHMEMSPVQITPSKGTAGGSSIPKKQAKITKNFTLLPRSTTKIFLFPTHVDK